MHEDLKHVEALKKVLEAVGVRVWTDESMLGPGDRAMAATDVRPVLADARHECRNDGVARLHEAAIHGGAMSRGTDKPHGGHSYGTMAERIAAIAAVVVGAVAVGLQMASHKRATDWRAEHKAEEAGWRRFSCRGASRYRFISRLAALHLPQGLNHLRELFGVRWHERFSVRNGFEDFDEVFQLRAAGGW